MQYADLHKSILNKIMTMHEQCIKYSFVAPLKILQFKRDPGQGVFVWTLMNFSEHVFRKILAGDCFFCAWMALVQTSQKVSQKFVNISFNRCQNFIPFPKTKRVSYGSCLKRTNISNEDRRIYLTLILT